MNTKLYL